GGGGGGAGGGAARADRPASHGLTVAGRSRLPASAFHPDSLVLVLPRMTAPAFRSRSTATASKSGIQFLCSSEPRVVRSPRVASRSLTVTGTPNSGKSVSP